MSSLKTEIDSVPKAQRLPEREERKVKLSNLTEKQKSLLGAAGAGVAGVSLGVIAMALMGAAESADGGKVIPHGGSGKEEVEIVIHTDAPFAEGVDDNMSFTEAFNAARAEVGSGGIFEWKGDLYNTYTNAEWDAMDKTERADFFASIDKDFLPGDENQEDEIIKIVNDNDTAIDDTEDIVIVDDNIEDPADDDLIVVKPEADDDIVVIEPIGDPIIIGDAIDIDIDPNPSMLPDNDILLMDEV